VDLTHFPINQCDATDEAELLRPMGAFHGTHKCDTLTTKVRVSSFLFHQVQMNEYVTLIARRLLMELRGFLLTVQVHGR